ncbi:DsbA family oxidoreductase [Cohaesibacter celericrescens]|uniref:DSBA-like thioredoxin domain-containing protein n=1 Tax=Cohaesibacter celericrescens TaxID=2067669 RepID=A0A2N5XTD4_9HYPH|nr:DsbA family oxidoreductase [Cohaesibacter celericrescens]PLW77763.1 hypothetical protein C0081_07725 [Cohaesibacter celericrescens]
MSQPLRIDIISDVVCPWCAIGYNQLRTALEEMKLEADIHWHPYQLNPEIPPQGKNLAVHLAGKYGITPEQSIANRGRITQLGADVGFTFNFTSETCTYNTLHAHQLIHWANEFGKEHAMKLALLESYFTDGKNVSDLDILVEAAISVGLDGDVARHILESNKYEALVREHMNFWRDQGITGVPAVVINSKFLVNGAAGVEQFKQAINGAVVDG